MGNPDQQPASIRKSKLCTQKTEGSGKATLDPFHYRGPLKDILTGIGGERPIDGEYRKSHDHEDKRQPYKRGGRVRCRGGNELRQERQKNKDSFGFKTFNNMPVVAMFRYPT
jgi:hypothetical protein